MKHEQLGEAINFYCIPKLFSGEAIANSLLAGAPPMSTWLPTVGEALRKAN